ncbi:hypothetical protein GOP47_0021929 [Adiantum capillus-veneris]|uniref:Uncharacterized protein n=1 Tax=Adiantum capillus-veneris TaxID=13818 RepID=A0A9D4Z7D9_ADICA|nr:hypothetical protein GOP47_0021929 [Adiantum capillus-veneris]
MVVSRVDSPFFSFSKRWRGGIEIEAVTPSKASTEAMKEQSTPPVERRHCDRGGDAKQSINRSDEGTINTISGEAALR